MNPLTCAEMAELIDELALDVLPGDERAEALGHLESCAACRGHLEALSEPADQLLFACPLLEPPPGFENRVLARLAADRPGRRRHRLARLTMAVAVAAAVVIVAAVAAMNLVGAGRATVAGGRPLAAGGAYGAELRTVALISSDGRPIGDVSAYAGPPTWFFLRVDRGGDSGTYECVLDVDGGRTIPLGTMSVTDGNGGWGQRVDVDARRVRSARLLDGSGSTIATATFG
jgi:hypothetical protein